MLLRLSHCPLDQDQELDIVSTPALTSYQSEFSKVYGFHYGTIVIIPPCQDLSPALVQTYFPYLTTDPLHESSTSSEPWSQKSEDRTDRPVNRIYINDYYDDDDERANAITIAVLLVMGVAFVVGVVFLIYSSSSVKTEYDTGDKDSVDLMNAVYQRRIADIITDASKQHQLNVQAYHSSKGSPLRASPQGQGQAVASKASQAAGLPQGKKLCPIVPQELGKYCETKYKITVA
ncbi:hypothetical protein RRG08_023232 [Elysia crispata]|uniref:Uncharacterized protein n=1 Tax=Elysia crispata TaxID=231223 RepID=A0AAE0ZRN0_9GAST|nr:hypothetical protein RRG08_023232 [Elysia crispata]